MSKLLLVSRERGILDERGGFAKAALPALSNLCASGFELILLTNDDASDHLFSEQQFQQVLESQGISFVSTIALESDIYTNLCAARAAETENEAIVAVAGRLAPHLSSGSYKISDSAVVGDWPGLYALANYLSMRGRVFLI